MASATIENFKLTIDRHVDLPGMQAEIRTYDWHTEETVVTMSAYYCFTHTLSTRDHSDPIHWKLPGSQRFLTFGWAGVTPPNIAIEVRRTPDLVRSLVLRVEPETFHRITGLDEGWYDERVMTRVNKEAVISIQMLNAIATELAGPGQGSEILLEALATAFLVRFARMVRSGRRETATGGLSEWQMNRIRDLVSTLPANQVSITRLAESCGISCRHLMRGFKAVMGTTVHAYVDYVRMERTKHKLRTTSLPLDDVAVQVGFASASHMSSAFSRAQGMAPSVFRQRFKH